MRYRDAHRKGKFTGDAGKPRAVVIKLLRFKDKQLTLSVYINKDFSDHLHKLPAMKEARARGDCAVISYVRLIVKPKRHGRRIEA